MGGPPGRGEAGAICTSSSLVKRPSKVTFSPDTRRRISGMLSSKRAPRVANSMPSDSNSLLAQPSPAPMMMRPSAMRSSEAKVLAACSGVR